MIRSQPSKRTVDGGLTAQLLQHLGGAGQPVTRLADGDVQDELLDAELPHRVLGLLGRLSIMLARCYYVFCSRFGHTMAAVLSKFRHRANCRWTRNLGEAMSIFTLDFWELCVVGPSRRAKRGLWWGTSRVWRLPGRCGVRCLARWCTRGFSSSRELQPRVKFPKVSSSLPAFHASGSRFLANQRARLYSPPPRE